MLKHFGVPIEGLELKVVARGAPPFGVTPHVSHLIWPIECGVLNRLLPNVYIFTDHYTGSESGKSPGYGISLVAETTTGCILSFECAATHSGASELQLPEDLGTQAAMSLLQEINLGGVVDSTHQGLLFILCALCLEDVSKVRVAIRATASNSSQPSTTIICLSSSSFADAPTEDKKLEYTLDAFTMSVTTSRALSKSGWR
ncbi:hypothetical protein SELMODRAFT_411685 [Selaginella moellendorffii]|uniref:RNA 3'-terminal phosphate cyclase insert domain-containing protein n=1 Tax=Selaginella moellendorffii TaxID=88036 RepID=D8RIQ2_SELML|nr:hypothetical protein SELMODRAFT_411685 [Selaginella moellendorffii]